MIRKKINLQIDENGMFNIQEIAKALNMVMYENGQEYVQWHSISKLVNLYGEGNRFRKYSLATIEQVMLIMSRCQSCNKHKLNQLLINNKIIDKEKTIIHTRFEISFGIALEKTLAPLRINIEKQKNIINGKYRIDFYIPEYKLAIEYDEEFHNNLVEPDKARQTEIEGHLECSTLRLDYRTHDCENVGLVLKRIFEIAQIDED